MNNWLKGDKFSKNDEYYTPSILVYPLLKYIKKDWVVWCPADEADSEYVLVLRENGINVRHSHISEGLNFLTYEPDFHYDCIITNCPFSRKKEFLFKCYKSKKPFALLLGLPILNYNEIGDFFCERKRELQLLIFNKKVSFDGNRSSFNSSYFCGNKFLPKQIIFCPLESDNTGDNFIPATKYKSIHNTNGI